MTKCENCELNGNINCIELGCPPSKPSLENTIKDLLGRITVASRGTIHWVVSGDNGKSSCISFSARDGAYPKRMAEEWLDDHRQKFPNGRFVDYEVVLTVVKDDADLLLSEAEKAIEKLMQILRGIKNWAGIIIEDGEDFTPKYMAQCLVKWCDGEKVDFDAINDGRLEG